MALISLTYFKQARQLGTYFIIRTLNYSFINVIIVLLVIGILLLAINALWNVFQKRIGHFVLAILLIILAFVLVCVLGLLMREQRKKQFTNIKESSYKCRDLLINFSEKDIEGPCGHKYLEKGA